VKANPQLRREDARDGESNVAWLKRLKAQDGILLLGGASLVHFRIRVAQSHLRRDMLPSFWSTAAVLRGGKTLHTVALERLPDTASVPDMNGVIECEVAAYDDPTVYPNVAFITFNETRAAVAAAIETVVKQRSIVDLPGLVVAWLGFVWGAGNPGNPLLAGQGVPSAGFVESVYALAHIELTPGLSSSASCPEMIWQSAKWWRDYYEERAETAVHLEKRARRAAPSGYWATRQRAAAVWDPKDPLLEAPTGPRRRRR
jgi:hypothetical protein